MGGSKNKSPAQKEKSQKKSSDKKDDKKKKGKQPESGKAEISVIIDSANAEKYLKNAKAITAYDFARQVGVKISATNAYLLKQLKKGSIKKVGGYSGHYVYQFVTE